MNLLSMSPKTGARLLAFWPPFWFTGISCVSIGEGYRHITMQMKLRIYNKNIIGIQYGGNLFSMVDPCYTMMLMHNLGKAYKVVDQAASIEFIKPGLGTVFADCFLSQEDIDDVLAQTCTGDKCLKPFTIEIKDGEGEVIARVHRTLYIRKKDLVH